MIDTDIEIRGAKSGIPAKNRNYDIGADDPNYTETDSEESTLLGGAFGEANCLFIIDKSDPEWIIFDGLTFTSQYAAGN